MRTRLRCVVVALALLVLLGGCSGASSCPARSADATQDIGTLTSDPVSIATDKNVYAPGDMVIVTFTNNLADSMRVTARGRSCPLVGMEQLNGGVWQGF